jgi:fatty acid synthase
VPRDEKGRSKYRLAAIRPSQIDLDDDDVKDFVAEISERTGEFLQIVNFNLRGSQYAIAGTVRGLEALEEEIERRREISGGKRSFILVPGIDVPFHSEVLRVGVADFRRSLERVMPTDADPELLVGSTSRTWCPGRSRWTATSSRRSAIWCRPSRSTRCSPTTTPGANERPRELMRKIVIELLAWQFASPVRWIETQDLLFIEEARGRSRRRAVRRDRGEDRPDGGRPGAETP